MGDGLGGVLAVRADGGVDYLNAVEVLSELDVPGYEAEQ